MSKRLRKVVSALLVALMVLTTASAMDIMASAAGDKTVTAQFIVDNNGKYMETLEETFSCTSRTANSATIKITAKYTINAHKYDLNRYDYEVKCGSVTTGRKTIVPANTWKNNATQAAKAQSKTASTTLTVPVNTTNATTVKLVCLQYQCNADGKIKYTEKEKPGTVSFSIPKYTAPAVKYTLSYNANGGTGAPAQQTGAAKYTVSSTKPTKSGYTFLGWAKSSTATASQYAPGSSITLTANTTLYAVWQKNSTTNIYNLGDETYSFANFSSCKKGKSCYGAGHCYGMAVTSDAFYNGIIDMTSVGAKSNQTVHSLSRTSAITEAICYYQGRQSSSTIVAGGRSYKGQSRNASADWNDVVNYVKSHSYDNKGSLIVSFRSGSAGHAVDFLYYKEVNGQQRLYVYDNNFPDTEIYLYKGSDGKIHETPRSTFGSSDCIALRSISKCIKYAGDFDGTHVIYANEGAIEVEGTIATPMDCGEECASVLYEIPENYCEVIITPLIDNAEFSYMDETYSFGEVGYDTYGVFTLAANDDGALEGKSTLKIENVPQKVTSVSVNDVTVNYKSSYRLVPEIAADTNASYTVEFTSSSPKVAAVDNDGNISTFGEGSTTITCTVTDDYGNSVTDTCTVNVTYTLIQRILKILFGWLGF